jgi:hypothetical protein
VTARVDDATPATSPDQMVKGGFYYTCVGLSEFKASMERLHSNGGADGAGDVHVTLPRCGGFEVRHATSLSTRLVAPCWLRVIRRLCEFRDAPFNVLASTNCFGSLRAG